MALTEAQIIKSLKILGLPVRTDVAFAYESDRHKMRQSEIARKLLITLEAEQEVEVTDILTQWATVEYATDVIHTASEGFQSNPSWLRGLLSVQLAQMLGYTGLSTSTGIRLSRG